MLISAYIKIKIYQCNTNLTETETNVVQNGSSSVTFVLIHHWSVVDLKLADAERFLSSWDDGKCA